MRLRIGLVAATLSLGCKPPPDAPAELEELTGYLFDHMTDEDDEALAEGLINLEEWLLKPGNYQSTLEGYTISKLSNEAVDRLDNKKRKAGALIGAAVASEHRHSMSELSLATVVLDQDVVFPDNYTEYQRTWSEGPACFPSKDCPLIDARSSSSSKWAGLVDVTTHNRGRARWVETDFGWFMMLRTYLWEPVDIDFGGIKLHGQYFIAVTFPNDDGGTVRLQATWMDADYGILPVSEDYAKRSIVSSMQQQGEDLELYLD